MDEKEGLIEASRALLGGAGSTLLAAMLGRLMAYTQDVRAKRTPLISWDLLWELPAMFGMAWIAEGIGSYLELNSTITTGLVAFLAYKGPQGIGNLIDSWANKKKP